MTIRPTTNELSEMISNVDKNCAGWRMLEDPEQRHNDRSYQYWGNQIETTEKALRAYCSKGDSYALNLVKHRHQAISFVSTEQQDDDRFILAMIQGYYVFTCHQNEKHDADRRLFRAIIFGNDMSSRVINEYGHLTFNEVREKIGAEMAILKERHRLESITSKPRFAFDFLKEKPIVKEEAAPKPKMRMKI